MNTKIKQTDYAYLAGYIDGDGCFYIGYERPNEKNKRRKMKPVVSIIISSVNSESLQTFQKMFGGSFSKVSDEHGNSKAMYQYRVGKQCSLKIIDDILPYLVERHDECITAKEFALSKSDDIRRTCIHRIKILKDVANLVSKYHKEEFERTRSTIVPTEEDFAYLAGFIDAECNLGIQKYKPKGRPNNTYKILLQCNNTKSPVFKWLIERFGGQLHFINRLSTQKARKNQLAWRLTGRALSKILGNIHKYLRHKKPVCTELIKFYETTLTNGGARHTEAFRAQYAATILIREDIVSKIHKLNLKGIQFS